MKFPKWKPTHYAVYLCLPLLFMHQIFLGADLASSMAFRIFWIALFVLAYADAAVWRIRTSLGR